MGGGGVFIYWIMKFFFNVDLWLMEYLLFDIIIWNMYKVF